MSKNIQIRKFLSEPIIGILKNIYYFAFKRKLFKIHKIYNLSDEKLKFAHILESINYLRIAGNNGELLPQTFFEFGCHSGRTFSNAVNSSDYLKMDKMEFFAFDSFEGLPSTDPKIDAIFKAGSFNTSYKNFKKIIKRETYLDLNEKNVIQGFYNKSLTSELREELPKIGVLHIDVDLYSSACQVLNFIKPLLCQGSVILFDDWYCFPVGMYKGEAKAFNEFLQANRNIKVQEWKNYSTFGKSFFVTGID